MSNSTESAVSGFSPTHDLAIMSLSVLEPHAPAATPDKVRPAALARLSMRIRMSPVAVSAPS